MELLPPMTGARTAARQKTAVAPGFLDYGSPSSAREQRPAPLTFAQIPSGSYTHSLYSLLRESRFNEAITLLNSAVVAGSVSRAALSLLAYCYYCIQDWPAAASCYEELVLVFPASDDYRLYQANALHKAGCGTQAMAVLRAIKDPSYTERVRRVHAAIKYEAGEYAACKLIVDQCIQEQGETIFNQACLLYKHGQYEEAILRFQTATKKMPYSPEFGYNIALCHYRLQNYPMALEKTVDLIEAGIREYPDLNVGVNPDDVLSVGNTPSLYRSFLVEVFNLKAAIELSSKNMQAAREALQDMPPRMEEELDAVTLHNQALAFVDEDPTTSFEKLIFLLQQPICPPETFGNLLLMYLRFEYYDPAADMFSANEAVARVVLSKYLYDFLSAVLLRSTSNEDSFKALDGLGTNLVEKMRTLSKGVQDARGKSDEETSKQLVHEYDQTLERYLPVLMAQAKLYWDRHEYHIVERIFRKSIEFCSEHASWKLNVAHVLFMQENKYKDAISFYEPLVQKYFDSGRILEITAIVLANLCVSYIMIYQNADAEDLMRRIEKAEQEQLISDTSKHCYHLCIVNLVIGTLYCSKGNFEFGISRVINSMEPIEQKLGTDTWYHASRCFVALYETLVKQMTVLKDDTYTAIFEFLDKCDIHGRDIPSVADPIGIGAIDPTQNSVAFEARLLKVHYLKLYN